MSLTINVHIVILIDTIGEKFYIILSGIVGVYIDHPTKKVLIKNKELGPNETFGE